MAETASLVIRVDAKGISTADSMLRNLARTGDTAERSAQRVTSSYKTLSNTSNELATVTSRLDAAIVGIISVDTIDRVISLSDSWTILTNKLELARTGNETVADAQQRVFDIAQRSRTSLEATATLYSRLQRAMKNTGMTGMELGRITETINKAMIVSGATSHEASAALIQFSQAMASGVLRGDEFRSVAEQAPRLTQIMSDALGVTIGQLRELAYSGKLSADVVIKSLSGAADTIDKEFSRTMPTFNQQWTVATNNLTKFMGESQKTQGAVAALGQTFVALSENLGTVVTVGSALATVITARIITAMLAKTKASIAAAKASQMEAAQTAATTAVMQSSIGVTAQKAAADRAASLAALQVARGSLAVAKGTAAEAGARLALINATRAHSAAIMADVQARQALNAALNATVPAASRAATAMSVLRGAMGLIGGPVGVAMLAAGAIYSYKASLEAGRAENNQFADSVDSVREKLMQMTEAQLAANAVKARAILPELEEQLKREQNALKSATETQKFYEAQLKRRAASGRDTASAEKNLQIATDNVKLAAERAEEAQRRYNNVLEMTSPAIEKIIPLARQLAADMKAVLNIKSGPLIDEKVLDRFKGQLGDVNREIDVNTVKGAGNARQAAILSGLYQTLGKDADTYGSLIRKVAMGQDVSSEATNESSRQLVKYAQELAEAYGKNYDLEEAERNRTKATKDAIKADNQNAKVVQDLRNKLEEVTTGVKENAKAKAQAVALNKLNASATAAEKAEVVSLAAAIYDAEEAQKKLDERKKNRKFAQGLLDEGMTDYEKIAYEQNTKIAELNAKQRADDLAYYQLYEDAKTQVLKKASMERENLDKVLMNRMISFSQESLGIILSGLEEGVSKQNFIYKAMFAAQKAMQIPSILANTETAASAALAWGTQQGGATMGAAMAGIVKAMGYASAATVGGLAIAGMAHDGIDNVPREGTWLLDKGERVLNAPSNDKLNRFLDSQGSQQGGVNMSGGVTIIQNITVQGNGDVALKQAMQQAARDGAEQGYNKVLTDFASRGTIRRTAMG
ncbi:tail tape measure protein [Escherichia phage KurtStettler]|nr:tail tape measure protein [Escherichia phage KurtStettler]